MSPQTDWFEQNAPAPAPAAPSAQGDWFEQNAPKAIAAAPASVPWYKQAASALSHSLDGTRTGAALDSVSNWMQKPAVQMVMSQLGAPDVEAINAKAGSVADMLPSAKLAKAGNLLNEVSNAVGENTVQMTDRLKRALDAVKEESSLGGGGGSIADKIMTRMANTDDVPLTYKEARIAYSNLGDLTTSDKMASNAKMLRLLNEARSALGETIYNTAAQGGKGFEYAKGMKDYATASAQQEKLDIITKWAKRVGVGIAAGATSGTVAHAGWDLYQKLFGDQ